MKWQPITTAPKDGSVILLYCKNGSRIPITGGYWDDHPKTRCWIAGGYMQKSKPPTHWMPLPDAPIAKYGTDHLRDATNKVSM